jgi:hypothetical protein
MVNKSTLISSLYGLVASRQPLDATFPTLDTANKTSASGYYVNDNPFAKLELLLDCQNYNGISASEFNTLLKQIQENAITTLVNSVFNEVDFIDRQMMYHYSSNKINTTLFSGLCARKIHIKRKNSIALRVSRVICEFEGTGTLKLLAFVPYKSTPLQTKTITINSNYVEAVLDWEFTGVDTDYIGYIASSGLKPYKRDYQNSNIKSLVTDLWFEDINNVNHTTEELWDLTTDFAISDDIGINLDLTVYLDYTSLAINNKHLFAKALNMQFAVNIIEEYIASMRSNINERKANEILSRAVVYLEGQTEPNVIGLKTTLGYEIKSLRKEIKRLTSNYFNGILTVQSAL